MFCAYNRKNYNDDNDGNVDDIDDKKHSIIVKFE